MRYLRLYAAFWANNISRAMEFRAQFVAGIIGYAFWSSISLIFINQVFGHVGAVRGWTKYDMWVLVGTGLVLESICWGLIGPNMWRFPTMIRDGSLDLALTKPVSTQFFVSARYMDLNGVLNALVGFALLLMGLNQVGRWPQIHEWLLWLLLLIFGLAMAYSLWFLLVTCSVWAVKLDAISVAFDPLMQMARFPVDIYPYRMRVFLTTILPIAFFTTFPAQALLGRLQLHIVPVSFLLAIFMLFLSHKFFHFALKNYGSASS